MTTRSILLANADPQVLVDITQLGAGWETTSVATEADAMAQFEQRSFDALLVDFNLGSPDASELLNQTLEKHPETIRFLLAYEADLALVAARVLGSYHILPKPIDPASLKSRIEQGVEDLQPKQSESDPADGVSNSPRIPPIYADVLKALESPSVTNEQVGDMIAMDEALTSEVLRLTHSAYLGLPRNLTDPVEAVESLGFETLKALVMALQFLAERSRLKPGYLSLEQLWEHSVNVGQIARDLMLFETKDRTLAAQALAAGLLHDLGKVVLATNFDDLYGRVHSLARKQPVTLCDIEKEMFGANHGEIGACLVGMWNMPSAIVEATALHHEPPLGEHEQLTPLAAVHIANVLEHQLRPGDQDMMVPPIINTYFLNELGLLERLPIWRAAFANGRSGNLEPAVEPQTDQVGSTVLSSTAESETANYLPGPAPTTRTTTSGPPKRGDGKSAVHAARSRRLWVYGGVAAGLTFLAVWLRTQPELNEPEPVYARTPAGAHTAAVLPATQSPETVPAAAPQVTPTVAVSEEPPAPSASSATVTNTAASLPEPEQTTTSRAEVPVANVLPPSVVPPEKALPDFRLNGIIYTSVRPSAIVNGETVNVGDQVNGATVVSIGRTTVTLQSNGQRKTYQLR